MCDSKRDRESGSQLRNKYHWVGPVLVRNRPLERHSIRIASADTYFPPKLIKSFTFVLYYLVFHCIASVSNHSSPPYSQHSIHTPTSLHQL